MKIFLRLRKQIAIAFCLIILSIAGCATSYQKVNADLLEQNKAKPFTLGIVKAAGDPSFGSWGSRDFEYRKKALNNIPIAEICSILKHTYSLNIDPNVNTTAKIVKEDKAAIENLMNGPLFGSSPPSESDQSNERGYPLRRDSIRKVADDLALEAIGVAAELANDLATAHLLRTIIENAYKNPYYGNLEYEKASSFLGIKNYNDFPDVVNVTYSLNYGPITVSYRDVSFYYDIDIVSSRQEIIKLHGTVGSIKAATEDTYDTQVAIWNLYADYAGRISEAIKRDLFKMTQK